MGALARLSLGVAATASGSCRLGSPTAPRGGQTVWSAFGGFPLSSVLLPRREPSFLGGQARQATRRRATPPRHGDDAEIRAGARRSTRRPACSELAWRLQGTTPIPQSRLHDGPPPDGAYADSTDKGRHGISVPGSRDPRVERGLGGRGGERGSRGPEAERALQPNRAMRKFGLGLANAVPAASRPVLVTRLLPSPDSPETMRAGIHPGGSHRDGRSTSTKHRGTPVVAPGIIDPRAPSAALVPPRRPEPGWGRGCVSALLRCRQRKRGAASRRGPSGLSVAQPCATTAAKRLANRPGAPPRFRGGFPSGSFGGDSRVLGEPECVLGGLIPQSRPAAAHLQRGPWRKKVPLENYHRTLL